jgi:excisionase family DNA binding protein
MPDMETPNPSDWITQTGAAESLRVDVRTIPRMIEDGRLSMYWPRGGRREQRPKLLWYADVLELRNARIRAGVQEP